MPYLQLGTVSQGSKGLRKPFTGDKRRKDALLTHCILYPRQTVRKRVTEKRGEDFKKEGKIYRLRTQDDGEDENNTWNGNSTQQM